jgi:dolichyl-phosphate-mannose-protein mannosyltransferase
MRLLSPILANLILISAAFGLGNVPRHLLPPKISRLDRTATTLLGGLGLLGTLLFLIGLIHFSLVLILVLLLPLALFGFFSFRKDWRQSAHHFRLSEVPPLPALVITLLLIVTFVGGLAEPVGDIKMDAIAYHLLGPHVWLLDARIHPLPDECLTAFPANVEALFAALMAMGGTRAPELFAVIAFGCLLLVAFGFALRLGLGPRGAWWAIALIAAMPVVYRGSYGGFNDAILASFVLLALRYALDAQEPAQHILGGIFAGLAMGTKYTGIISLLLIVVCILVFGLGRRKSNASRIVEQLLAVAASAGIVASPWYLRNWIVLGSPIYPPTPFLLRYFLVKYMSPAAIGALAALIQKEGLGMGHSLTSFLLLPLHFTFHPANFLNGAGGVGIALLALAPFGFLAYRSDAFVRILTLFLFLQTVAWFVTEQEARFLIHVYVILAILAIRGWRYVAANAPRCGPLLAGTTIACSILYGLIMIVSARISDMHAALSVTYENQRKLREIPFFESFAYLNLDPAPKRLLILEPRLPTFYLNSTYLKPVGRFGEETIPDARDTQKILKEVVGLGITHILDARLEKNGFRVPIGNPGLVLIFERPDERIYRVSMAQR